MAYRNKVFVSFDGDTDIHYYRLMRAWKQNDSSDFNFFDAHDVNTARDTSLESSIKARLRERMLKSKIFLLLVGEKTRYLYKFVRWEIEQAMGLDLPIICVNLNKTRHLDRDRCPPILRDATAMHVSFNPKIVQYALEHWPSQHSSYETKSTSGPYYYRENIYRSLGI